MRHILRTFFEFGLFMPLAEHRKELPADAAAVARIVASRDEDCGTCVQIAINVARQEGVPDAVLSAVIEHRPDELPNELAQVYRFTEAVVTASGAEDELREVLRARYGELALVELALALASTRVFPVTKRALGYAQSCALAPPRV